MVSMGSECKMEKFVDERKECRLSKIEKRIKGLFLCLCFAEACAAWSRYS